MRDYEDLVKSLRYCAEYDCTTVCPRAGTGNGCITRLKKEAADAIEELSRENRSLADTVNKADEIMRNRGGKWISAKEQLPEEDGWYQVYAPYYSGGSSSGLKNVKSNMYSAFKHGKWSIEVGYHKRPGCVKAWMPLPEPPKESTNDSR